MDSENVAIVRQAYADFAAGNIDGILRACAEGIVWETDFPPELVPFGGRLTGKDGVRGFFEKLARTTTFSRFDVNEFVASGDKVVALGSYDTTVNETGKRAGGAFAMAFTLRDGTIAAFREYADTYAVVRAWTADEGRIATTSRSTT